MQLKCSDGQVDDNLDSVIAESLHTAFTTAYQNLSSSFNKNSLELAYNIYLTTNYIKKATENVSVNLKFPLSRKENSYRIAVPRHWTENHKWAMNMERTQWYVAPGNELLLYTGEELYHLAVKAAADVIKIGEDFVQSRKPGALMHLKNSGHILLQENYNLDTGLPSRYNDNDENREPNSIVRFGFMAKQLSDNYKKFT